MNLIIFLLTIDSIYGCLNIIITNSLYRIKNFRHNNEDLYYKIGPSLDIELGRSQNDTAVSERYMWFLESHPMSQKVFRVYNFEQKHAVFHLDFDPNNSDLSTWQKTSQVNCSAESQLVYIYDWVENTSSNICVLAHISGDYEKCYYLQGSSIPSIAEVDCIELKDKDILNPPSDLNLFYFDLIQGNFMSRFLEQVVIAVRKSVSCPLDVLNHCFCLSHKIGVQHPANPYEYDGKLIAEMPIGKTI